MASVDGILLKKMYLWIDGSLPLFHFIPPSFGKLSDLLPLLLKLA